MNNQGRLKDRFKNKFNCLLHSFSPGHSRSPSPPTSFPQASVGSNPASIHGVPDTQPLNLPSLSNIYPSIVIDPAEDETPGRTASAGYQGLKTTLRLIERATDVFPPLKSTVAGLLGVIDIVEVRDFQLSVVILMVLTIPRQPRRTNEIATIWNRS